MDHRSYYAIIPANVRYDDSLIPSAKLLYGEITALCNEKGYCWASNEYFANQYKVSKPTIQNWLKSLEEKGYIYREVKYKEGSKEIEARYIRILGGGHQENLVRGHQEIYQDNNTSINNTFNNTKEYIRELPPSKKSKAKPIRHKYGEYKNVLLSDEQMEKLK
ncbi:helix-turn-helix domain-containing protein, partial [Enterococcus faecium]